GGLFGGGAKSTTSGDDGSFVLSGAGARTLMLAAEEASTGRSSMVRVPAGDTSVQVDLVLKPFGALEGHVASGGVALGGALVMANPQQAARGTFMVRTGDDGNYRFDKLAPDTYRVSAMKSAGGMGGNLISKVVPVQMEATARADFDLPGGGVTVSVSI